MSVSDVDLIIKDLLERIRILETTQAMASSSVSRGCSRFVGNESILVDGSGKVVGWWIVTGTQRVTGRLEGSGTLDWTGPWNFRGNGDIDGDVDINGKARIRNDATLEADLEVLPGGRVRVGDMTIDPTGGSGRVRFANGGQVWAEADAIKMMIGTSAVSASNGTVLVTSGGTGIQVSSDGIRFVGTLPAVAGTGMEPGTLIRGPGGVIYEAN